MHIVFLENNFAKVTSIIFTQHFGEKLKDFISSLQPKTNFNEWRLVYFLSFLLLVGFFVLNMFVGVVVENFHKCRASQEREEKARRDDKHAKKLVRQRRRKALDNV